jgi:methylenetetrahydrofolate dehydrogenase (NADP+)/methenyltetrahydrofolate cyclohydrolase
MTAKIIDGKAIASEIKNQLKEEVRQIKSSGATLALATLLVGDNPASQVYLKSKHRACNETGIDSFNHVLPKDSEPRIVFKKLEELNRDPKINAILVQLPLPPHVNTEQILSTINPKKDVDGFHPVNLGRLFAAKDIRELMEAKNPIPLPCTPQGVLELIRRTGISLSGKNAVVIGRSLIVGKPTAALLLAHHCTVTIAHSQTKNLIEYTQKADILIAAIGKPKAITADLIRKGAIVIDVGINRDVNGNICGDVDFESAKEKAGWITPVPGGVGPMTIAMLLKNTVQLARTTVQNSQASTN